MKRRRGERDIKGLNRRVQDRYFTLAKILEYERILNMNCEGFQGRVLVKEDR